jgi:hypothetical protein
MSGEGSAKRSAPDATPPDATPPDATPPDATPSVSKRLFGASALSVSPLPWSQMIHSVADVFSPSTLTKGFFATPPGLQVLPGDGGGDGAGSVSPAFDAWLALPGGQDAAGGFQVAAAAAPLVRPQPVPQYATKLAPLAPRTLQHRAAYESSRTDDLLMLRPGTLRRRAMVLRYTFPATVRKNAALQALLEQANKAVGSVLTSARADPLAELTCGRKLALFNSHVCGYVVLLPISAPHGVEYHGTDDMLDATRCRCFTGTLIGHLVLLDYVSDSGPSKGAHVLYAWGVVVDRAYANDLDLATRVRFAEDDPASADPTCAGVDRNQMVLPVRILGLAGKPDVVTTWDALCDCDSEHADTRDAAARVEFVYGMPQDDQAAVETQARLPPELHVFVPHMHAATTTGAASSLYSRRAAAIAGLAASSGGLPERIVNHMCSQDHSALHLPPTARANAKPRMARLGTVLETAARQALVRFQ